MRQVGGEGVGHVALHKDGDVVAFSSSENHVFTVYGNMATSRKTGDPRIEYHKGHGMAIHVIGHMGCLMAADI